MIRTAFFTLGCKLNQLETESIADGFHAVGFEVVPFERGADLYVINTCTVTTKAEQKARRVIRKVLLENPRAAVVVTGCYTQVAEAAIGALGERVVPVRLDRKDAILDLPDYITERTGQADRRPAGGDAAGLIAPGGTTSRELLPIIVEWHATLAGKPDDRFRFTPAGFSFHTRAFLKIQDGCNNNCAYCLIHIARGKSVSLDSAEVVRRVRALEDAGYNEVVLTGVNLAQYRSGDVDFPGLLGLILAATGRLRLRISSYDPDSINDRFLAAIADERICPHFHLSVQSGSDAVLRAMRRRHTARMVRDAMEAIRRVKGDPFFATDFIVGFPGETDADFRETVRLAEEADFAWLHVFPFSPRPGTPAAAMAGHVLEATSRERATELTGIAGRLKAAYAARWIGKPVSAIIEHPEAIIPDEGNEAGNAGSAGAPGSGTRADATPARTGAGMSCMPHLAVTDNYLKVVLAGPVTGKPGSRVTLRITGGSADPAAVAAGADATGTIAG